MNRSPWIPFLLAVLTASGCATIPPGPSVMVMPGQGKSFEAFQADDFTCREWAQNQAGWQANEAVNQNLAGGAVVGGALGAAAGALIGAASGNVGPGAAIGAGAGLLAGAAMAHNRLADRHLDAANPRTNNTMGHIIQWIEDGDFDGTTFRWTHLVLAGL